MSVWGASYFGVKRGEGNMAEMLSPCQGVLNLAYVGSLGFVKSILSTLCMS